MRKEETASSTARKTSQSKSGKKKRTFSLVLFLELLGVVLVVLGELVVGSVDGDVGCGKKEEGEKV